MSSHRTPYHHDPNDVIPIIHRNPKFPTHGGDMMTVVSRNKISRFTKRDRLKG